MQFQPTKWRSLVLKKKIVIEKFLFEIAATIIASLGEKQLSAWVKSSMLI